MPKFGNSEFSNKPINYYNLNMIISVGYRVKSQSYHILYKDGKQTIDNSSIFFG